MDFLKYANKMHNSLSRGCGGTTPKDMGLHVLKMTLILMQELI